MMVVNHSSTRKYLEVFHVMPQKDMVNALVGKTESCKLEAQEKGHCGDIRPYGML